MIESIVKIIISNIQELKKQDGTKSKTWKMTISSEKYGTYQFAIERQGKQTTKCSFQFSPELSQANENDQIEIKKRLDTIGQRFESLQKDIKELRKIISS